MPTYPMNKQTYIGLAGVMGLEEDIIVKVTLDLDKLKEKMEIAKSILLKTQDVDMLSMDIYPEFEQLQWDVLDENDELRKTLENAGKMLIRYDGEDLKALHYEDIQHYRFECTNYEIRNNAIANKYWSPSIYFTAFARHFDGKLWINLPSSAWE